MNDWWATVLREDYDPDRRYKPQRWEVAFDWLRAHRYDQWRSEAILAEIDAWCKGNGELTPCIGPDYVIFGNVDVATLFYLKFHRPAPK